MSDELQELRERAEEAAQHASLAPVTVTMAIFAVLVAAVSLLGHRAHTHELLHQTEAADQWAYYQAKDTRLHSYELFLDQLSVFTLQNSADIEKIRGKYGKEIERYTEQKKESESKATEFENDVKREGRRADRFDLGEVLLEAGLVICSITLLTRKRFYWGMGLVLGLVGVFIAAAGFLIR